MNGNMPGNYPATIRITKLDSDGAPAGDPMTATVRVVKEVDVDPRAACRIPFPRFVGLFRDAEVVMYDPATRRTTRINTGDSIQLTPEQRTSRERNLQHLGHELGLPSFLLEERQRDEDHAWQVRRDKKRKALAEIYGGAPAKWLDAAADQGTPRTEELRPATEWCAGPCSPPGWIAPQAIDYGRHEIPDLRSVNHPCKLPTYGKNESRQEEGPHSMYTTEAIEQAAYTLQQEREAREAAEIISRIKAFGEDVYADATVLRFTRQFYKNAVKTQLHAPVVFSALRFTDSYGNTTWADDEGMKRSWDALVTWLVTWGKPITLDDIEIFPPAVFPTTAANDNDDRVVSEKDL